MFICVTRDMVVAWYGEPWMYQKCCLINNLWSVNLKGNGTQLFHCSKLRWLWMIKIVLEDNMNYKLCLITLICFGKISITPEWVGTSVAVIDFSWFVYKGSRHIVYPGNSGSVSFGVSDNLINYVLAVYTRGEKH